MSSTKKKTAKKAKMKNGKKHTPNKNEQPTNEPTTDTKGRRSASPEGQPVFSTVIPPENDDKDGSTQGELSMPLQTDQLPTTDQQSAAINVSSQERVGYEDKNTTAIFSYIQQLPQVVTQQMKFLAEEQTR